MRPYRKHKPLPALIVVAVLGITASVIWINAVSNTVDLEEAMRCTPSAQPPEGVTYDPQPYDALSTTQPAPPQHVNVQVLNASGLRGEAGMTSMALEQLGFTQVQDPGNDEAFPKGEAVCHGQVRYGTNGEAAARTLRLIDPCLQLVEDGRQDATVDLAIGTGFNDVRPTSEALDVLEQLKKPDQSAEGGSEQSAGGEGAQANGGSSLIDQELLDKTVAEHC
ncbi:envelope integrity protein Cei [Saccharomonospora sp. CUA-673]|uniref:envelope integrity protein Cei n=1 Tax=Saccharomonospora sp. CUA-673 TaxID=1904969 RepID=UPI000A996DA2|nr:envelope integrity protein Cei [Saccharomonospora sp. CUA-673]